MQHRACHRFVPFDFLLAVTLFLNITVFVHVHSCVQLLGAFWLSLFLPPVQHVWVCVCASILSKGFWYGGRTAFFLSHCPACKREIYCSVDGLRQSQVHRPQPRIEGDGLGPGWGPGRGWGLWVSLLTFKMPHNGHSLATGCSHSNLYASPACDTNKFAHICPGGQSICNSDDFFYGHSA